MICTGEGLGEAGITQPGPGTHPSPEALSHLCVDSLRKHDHEPSEASPADTPMAHRHLQHSIYLTHIPRMAPCVHPHRWGVQPLQMAHKHAEEGSQTLQDQAKAHNLEHFRAVSQGKPQEALSTHPGFAELREGIQSSEFLPKRE